jgi:hypothetical protein
MSKIADPLPTLPAPLRRSGRKFSSALSRRGSSGVLNETQMMAQIFTFAIKRLLGKLKCTSSPRQLRPPSERAMFVECSTTPRQISSIRAQPNVKGIFCMWHNLRALSLHVCKAGWGSGKSTQTTSEAKDFRNQISMSPMSSA